MKGGMMEEIIGGMEDTTAGLVRKHFHITRHQAEVLSELSDKSGRSESEWVREALSALLFKKEQ
jgi:predicted DNA-binding protein